MTVWLCTFFLLLLIVLSMAVGVLLSNKSLSGSCGGLNKLGLKEDCPICGKKSEKPWIIDHKSKKHSVEFYDATLPKKALR